MASTPASMFHIVTTGLHDLERLNAPKGNPTIRFYSAVFMRRTRWASQWRRVEFDNLADFGKKATVTLPQLGELISRVILVVNLPDLYTAQAAAKAAAEARGGPEFSDTLIGPTWNWTNSIGHALCSSMELQIGDHVIDTIDSRLMEILDEQTRPVEHFDTTNSMIGRDPSAYTSTVSKQPVSVEIVPPFWFNRGPGPQAFPIQALAKDKVQITVNFRPIQQCVYTDARVDPRNPPLSASQGPGPLPNIAGCGFFATGGEDSQPIYNMTQNYFGFGEERTNSPIGSLLAGNTMPAAYHFRDAYWIVEYISLEDREAAAFRMADLQIPIEQHVAVPPVETGGAPSLRIPLNEVGLVRDLTWIAQRVEAPDYNAYFLFSRDLGPPGAAGSFIPWWPDAVIPLWDYGDGYVQPAFVTRQSDPIKAATLWYRGQRRFDHETPSFFRSLVPILNCQRVPLINRYIYRYDFGFWPTGGIGDALTKPVDQVRGFSNWDKIPKKELDLTFDLESCSSTWILDPTQAPVTFTEASPLNELLSYFSEGTQAFQVDLSGSVGSGSYGGDGATVRGILNFKQLRSLPNFTNVIARVVPGGSASLALQTFDGTSFGYQWLAVAGSGGEGSTYATGGDASSAIAVASQGGNSVQTHDASSNTDIITFTNDISGYTTVTGYGFTSPTYTVTAPGIIYGWRTLTGVWSGSIANYIYINGVYTQAPYTLYPGNTAIDWRDVTLVTPISVYPGDTIFINHTSLGTTRLYDCATNASFAIVSIPVQGPGVILGGGGGGRGSTLGPGQADGLQMPVVDTFVLSTQQTGGSLNGLQGGDGYTGGGSGFLAGGGGGSFVSRYMTGVLTEDGTNSGPASITVTPLVSMPAPRPTFTIYAWATTYNMLRITGGRGALLFSA
jgi:hypothetical protein